MVECNWVLAMIAWLGFPKNPRFEAPGHVKRDKVSYLTERFKSPAMEVLLNVEFGAPTAAQMKSPLERMCGQKFKSRWHVEKSSNRFGAVGIQPHGSRTEGFLGACGMVFNETMVWCELDGGQCAELATQNNSVVGCSWKACAATLNVHLDFLEEALHHG